MAGLDRAALAALRRLLPALDLPLRQMAPGYGACPIFDAHLDTLAVAYGGPSDRQRQPEDVAAAIVQLANAAPALLALAERAATLDAALLARLEARYGVDESAPTCAACGVAMRRYEPRPMAPIADVRYWRCPIHEGIRTATKDHADSDVLALAAWARSLASGEGDGGNIERKEQGG